ncbi:MAG: DUF2442 domain-containing protein [Rickettsiales bacterium]|jgi:hypothetical protein|nr:DUF2442 domain-containing protein [Rickettsiales bacterium]
MKNNKMIHIISVFPLPDYKLLVEFDTKEKKSFDMTGYIKNGVFRQLADVEKFNQVRISLGTVAWGDMLDIAPEKIYSDGIPV